MEKYVCPHCIDDYAIQNFISAEAVSTECDYCDNGSQRESIAAALTDVANFVLDGLYKEWSNPDDEGVLWDSEDGRYMVPTWDTHDLIERELDTEEELRWDLVHKLPDHEWCQANPLRLSKDEELDLGWEGFSEQLKHETRYVFFRVEPEESGYDYAGTPHEILDTIGDFVREYDLILDLPQNTEIIRARPHDEDEKFSNVEELGPPPKEKALYANRMSPAGIPMFYGCVREATALAEIEQKDFATVANFHTLKSFKILDLNRIPPIPSFFDQQKSHERPAVRFLNHFLSDFSKRVDNDGREHRICSDSSGYGIF